MYKLLVADDEKIVTDSMSYIVKKNFNDIMVITARSGREAIEKVEAEQIDLVIMDIKMPGINGIEAIKEIKESHPNTYFIIISAYEKFEFAKEAVKLGVYEYITKPINKNSLIESIKKSLEQLEQNRAKKNFQLETIERYRKALPFLEQGFVYAVLMKDNYKRTLLKYGGVLGIDEEGGYILVVELKPDSVTGGFDFLDENFYENLREEIKYSKKCLVGHVIGNKVIIFVPQGNVEEYEARVEAMNLAEYIINFISAANIGVKTQIGIGSYKKLEYIAVSYDEAMRALHSDRNNGVIHIRDIYEAHGTMEEYPKRKEADMIDRCLEGKTEEAVSLFKEIYKYIYDEYEGSIEKGKSKFIYMWVLLNSRAYDLELEDNKFDNYISDIIQSKSYEEIEYYFIDRIECLCDKVKSLQQKRINGLIAEAKNYIQQHYSEDINLEDAARKVCLSSNYFSRLFKEQVGENFIDYITRVRINRAKELMKANEASIKDICFKVGYQDPNYFSRLFKKIENVTPTEYIKTIK